MPPSKKSPDKKLPADATLLTEKSSTEQFKYVAVMLEQVQDQVKAVAESLDMTRTELNDKIDKVYAELKQDIEMTQMAVKSVKGDLEDFKKGTNKRFDRIEIKLNEHDKRFDRLEEKLDAVAEKVDHHDEEIVFLKAAVAK